MEMKISSFMSCLQQYYRCDQKYSWILKSQISQKVLTEFLWQQKCYDSSAS